MEQWLENGTLMRNHCLGLSGAGLRGLYFLICKMEMPIVCRDDEACREVCAPIAKAQ